MGLLVPCSTRGRAAKALPVVREVRSWKQDASLGSRLVSPGKTVLAAGGDSPKLALILRIWPPASPPACPVLETRCPAVRGGLGFVSSRVPPEQGPAAHGQVVTCGTARHGTPRSPAGHTVQRAFGLAPKGRATHQRVNKQTNKTTKTTLHP